MQFKDLELSQEFTHNGNNYIKNSNRTAKMLSNSRVFYFASYETIYVYKVSNLHYGSSDKMLSKLSALSSLEGKK